MLNKKGIRIVLAWAVIALVAYLFARSLINNWNNIQTIGFSFNGYSLVSLILFVLAVLCSGILWGQIVRKLGMKISDIEAMRVHTSSWLLKYIPGQAGSFINKLAWGTKNGHSKKVTTISFIYENVFLLLASLALSIPIIVLSFKDVSDNTSMFLPLLLGLLIIPALNKKVFYSIFNYVFKRFRNQTIDSEYFFGTKDLVEFFVKFLLPRIITGAGFVFVAASFLQVTPDMYIGLGSAYILAGIVGILAIFVPSGLGVREAVIVLLVSHYFSTETAVALSLIARLYSTIADGLLALVYVGLTGKRKLAE